MSVAAARRIGRPAWVNARTVGGLVLFALSLALGQRILAAGQEVQLLWAAARDLPQDAVLDADDVRLARVTLPADLLAHYVSEAVTLEGQVVTRPIAEGELVAAGWVVEVGAEGATRAITIPVAPEHALGGDLRPGDRVDVYATFNPGAARASSSLLARAIEVIDVVTSGGFAVEDDLLVGVTVAIDPEDAARLAFAIRTAEIDLAKVIGPVGADSPGADPFP